MGKGRFNFKVGVDLEFTLRLMARLLNPRCLLPYGMENFDLEIGGYSIPVQKQTQSSIFKVNDYWKGYCRVR